MKDNPIPPPTVKVLAGSSGVPAAIGVSSWGNSNTPQSYAPAASSSAADDPSGVFAQDWWDWLFYIQTAVRSLQRGGEPAKVPSYVKAKLPAAASWTDGLVVVTDEAGGRVPAFSDGTSWRRVTDRAVVS